MKHIINSIILQKDSLAVHSLQVDPPIRFYQHPTILTSTTPIPTTPMLVSKPTKNDFNVLITKAFRASDKTKQFVVDVAHNLNTPMRDLMGWPTLDEPEMQITEYLIDKFNTLKHIQEPQAAAITLIHKFFNALDVQIEGKLKDEIEDLAKKILEPSPQSENVANIWHENIKAYDCICGMAHKEGDQGEVCYKCGKICHPSCFWERQATDTLFQCPACFLLNCMPEKKVKDIIFLGYCKFNHLQRITHNLKFYIDMKRDPHDNVEIRCCRLNKKTKYEITFPQYCNIYLSNSKLTEFRPLPLNSPLKRRSDEEIPINKFRLSYLNTLTIQERHSYSEDYRIFPSDHHLILIANIEPVSKIKLQKQYLQRKLQMQQSKKILSHYLGTGNHDLIVDRLTLSMKCQYYRTSIAYPARSKHCTTHYQPFDMLSFINASITAKNSVQKWRCPICKKRAYDLVLDQYLHSLIKDRANVSDITFSLLKDPIIRESEPSQEDEDNYDKEKEHMQFAPINNISIDIDSDEGSKPIQANHSAKQVPAKQTIIDILSDSQEDDRKRPFEYQKQPKDSQQNKQGRKIHVNAQRTDNSGDRNQSSKDLIITKLKERITQMSQPSPKPIISQTQHLPHKSNPIINQHIALPKGFHKINPTIDIKQPSLPPKPTQQSLIKTQLQLLNEANSILLQSKCRVSLKDQIIFNSICSKLVNFKICP